MFNSLKENWIVQILAVALIIAIWYLVGPRLIAQISALINLYSGNFAPVNQGF